MFEIEFGDLAKKRKELVTKMELVPFDQLKNAPVVSFADIMKDIVSEIELNDYKKIGFVCNYGKHRSVGWAELIKKLYYNESIIKHNNL